MDANWRIELEAFMAGPVAALLRDGLVGAYAKHDLVRQVRKGIVARYAARRAELKEQVRTGTPEQREAA